MDLLVNFHIAHAAHILRLPSFCFSKSLAFLRGDCRRR
jgi:hypothetical protein